MVESDIPSIACENLILLIGGRDVVYPGQENNRFSIGSEAPVLLTTAKVLKTLNY